jgi:D-mannonate dehydratase
MIPEPPVNKLSPRGEIEEWIEELERLVEDPALEEEETQQELRAHLNDARTWLAWDLHRKVVEEGREVTAVLQEVGALTREPGDPPPEDAGDGS